MPLTRIVPELAPNLLRVDGSQNLSLLNQGRGRGNLAVDTLNDFRNKLINGSFDIWQRGASFNAGGYGTDRWATSWSGGSGTVSRAVYGLGDTVNRFGLRFNLVAAPNFLLGQWIENVKTFAGKRVTLTFTIRQLAGAPVITRAYLMQSFGTGGSASSPVSTPIQTITYTSDQQVQLVFDVPSITGKILGTGGTDALGVFFGGPVTAVTGDIIITRVSLVEGDATGEADPFSDRHISQELALCQRYYETRGVYYEAYGVNKIVVDTPFSVVKRVGPTMGITATYSNANTGQATSASTERFLTSWLVNAQGMTTINGTWTADAEI